MPASLVILMFSISSAICMPYFYFSGKHRRRAMGLGDVLRLENVLYALRGITTATGMIGSLLYLVARQVAGPSAPSVQILSGLSVLCFLFALSLIAGHVRAKLMPQTQPAKAR